MINAPPEPRAPLTHRSVSQFGSFTKCGEQFRLEKVEHAPKRPAAWLAQGVAFHAAAEAWELSLRTLSAEAVIELYFSEYDRIIAEETAKEPELGRWLTGGRVKATDDIARRRARGAEQVQVYITYALSASERLWQWQGEPVAVEVQFSLDLDGLEVIGYIDQIIQWSSGHVGPRDLKTGTKRPDWAFQLGVYALAIEQETGFLPRWGDFWMAKDGRPDPPVDLSPFTREKVTRWFKNADKAIKLGLFTPNPGDHCRTCSVPDFCQALGSRAHEFPYQAKEDAL